MSIANSDAIRDMEPIFVILVIAWMAYMAFEAYHTAPQAPRGEPVDEYSSMLNLRGGPGRFPGGRRRADPAGRAVAAAHARSAGFRIRGALLAGAADRGRSVPAVGRVLPARNQRRERCAMRGDRNTDHPRHPRTRHADHGRGAVRPAELHALQFRPDLAGAADRVRPDEPAGADRGAAAGPAATAIWLATARRSDARRVPRDALCAGPLSAAAGRRGSGIVIGPGQGRIWHQCSAQTGCST